LIVCLQHPLIGYLRMTAAEFMVGCNYFRRDRVLGLTSGEAT